MGYMVLVVTNLTFLLEKYCGVTNCVYVLCALLGSRFVHKDVFMYATSFLHHLIYMGTYHQAVTGEKLSFLLFMRNAFFYKTFSLMHLAYNYVKNFSFDPVSIALIATGYFITSASLKALGVERTYFGAEL